MTLLTLRLTQKGITLSLVSHRLWVEWAAWDTRSSDLKGWRVEKTRPSPIGWRLITPLVGMAFCIDWRSKEEV